MKKGDILNGSDRRRIAAYHPIVYLEGNQDGSFIGAVLTHFDQSPDNVPMKKEYFIEMNKGGGESGFVFDNTYLVGRRFIKPQDWGPFKKIGELTEEGIEFVESITGKHHPVHWDDYAPQ